MEMHKPPHPGEGLRELCIEPLGISVTEAAESLGVSRKTLSAVLNGRAGISPKMAIRLGKAFDTTPESWLNQQMMYDLYMARKAMARSRLRSSRRHNPALQRTAESYAFAGRCSAPVIQAR